MPRNDRFLDDMARMAGSAVSLISTVREQVKSDLKERVDTYARKIDGGSADEIEHLRSLVSKLRLEQEALKKRIEILEGKKSPSKAAPKNAPKTKAKKK